MNIIYDHQIFSLQRYGGISRYISEISSRIPYLEGDNVEVFCPLHVNGYLSHNPACRGIKLPDNRLVRRGINVANRGLGKIFVGRKYDVQVFHETYYCMTDYAPRSAKRIVTVHDMIHERLPHSFRHGNKASEIKRHAVSRADHVICVSENTRRDVLEIFGVPFDKTSVVYHGYSLSAADKEGTCRGVAEKPFLLYVGARGTYKNFSRLLSAYARSALLKGEYSLVCFGGGRFTQPEMSLIKSLGLSLKHVLQVHGGDMVLSNLYCSASALVYPSLYEGFGIPPLEAMSHDCPVICSNTSSLPEVVGEAAEQFDPNHTEDIRRAIEQVVSSRERSDKLITLGRQQIKKFSWEKCARETLVAYKHSTAA